MRYYIGVLFLSTVFISSVGADERVLTFDEAVARTLCGSPEINVAEDGVGEQQGLRRQYGLYPNPIFSYSVENIWGNKDWRGWESAESRFELGQFIELGGKRKYRNRFGDYQVSAAEADYEAHKISVLNQLLKAFTDVAGYQELLDLALEQTETAESIHGATCDQVDAGKVSPIQQNKTAIGLATAKIDVEKAAVNFEKAKERLSLIWGEACPDFDMVDWDFYELEEPQPLEQCISLCADHPELMRAYFEYLSSRQNLKLEKAGAIPDITVVVGCKTLHESHQTGMILGAAIPIPVFNLNQGNVQKARFESQRILEEYRTVQILLENKLSIAYKELMRTYKETEQIRSTILKNAQESFECVLEGYTEGKFEYLDLLDAQSTLFYVKERYIEALINYHKNSADIKYFNCQDD